MSKHLFHESFFCRSLVFLTSVSLLWFMSLYYEILIVVLSLFVLCCYIQPFNVSPVSFACNFQDWGCVILREIDFLLKKSFHTLQLGNKLKCLNQHPWNNFSNTESRKNSCFQRIIYHQKTQIDCSNSNKQVQSTHRNGLKINKKIFKE